MSSMSGGPGKGLESSKEDHQRAFKGHGSHQQYHSLYQEAVHEPLRMPQLLGPPRARRHSQHDTPLTPLLTPSCGWLSVRTHKTVLWQMAVDHLQKVSLTMWPRKRSQSLTLGQSGESKERLSALALKCCMIKGRHTNLRMLPQEGARNCEADIPTESL